MADKSARRHMADTRSVKIGSSRDPLLLSSWWKRIVTFFPLFMAPLAVCFLVLLLWGVDKELSYVSEIAKLRQQADRILLNLIEMGTTERAFSATRDSEQYQRFFRAAQALDSVFNSIEPTVQENHSRWRNWLGEVRKRVEERRKMLTRRIMTFQQTPKEKAQPPGNATAHDETGNITSDQLTKLIATFVHEEEKKLVQRRESLDYLRTKLVFAAIIAVISTFLLIFAVIRRLRRDVRRLNSYQFLLHSENTRLEQRVKDRTAELETARTHAEKERQRVESILHDTSHRIGNSLATVSSLLGLQLQRSDNAQVQAALASARDRIQTIAAAHRRLRLGEDMETANIGEFLSAVVNDVQTGIPADQCGHIQFRTHFEDWHLASRDVTTLGIILGELLTNAVKHAFPNGRHGKIDISFGKLGSNKLQLVVEDNGIGLSDNDETPNNAQGLGKIVISQLCTQFGAEPSCENRKPGGTRVIIPLPNLATRKTKAKTAEKTKIKAAKKSKKKPTNTKNKPVAR